MAAPPLASLSSGMRLLLRCCPLHPTPAQVEALRRAAAEVSDWDGVPGLAWQGMLVPLAYRNLSGHGAGLVPAPVLERLSGLHRRAVRHTLLLAAEARVLAADHLQPLGIPAVFLKGPLLAQTCYGAMALRQARDLDLLVPEGLPMLVARLRGAGYRLVEEGITGDADLAAYLALMPTLALRSPGGVTIELHRRLDYLRPAGREASRLETEEATLAGVVVAIPRLEEHFVLLCAHHAGHAWSKLHWLADLEAVSTHPGFDLEAVRRRAERWGVSRLTGASLLLRDHFFRDGPIPSRGLAAATLSQCLASLGGGPSPPGGADRHGLWGMRARWLGNHLQSCDHLGPCLGRVVARAFAANYADYRYWPLPPRLRRLYPLVRMARWLDESLRGRARGVGGGREG